jgi:hypothetical protein
MDLNFAVARPATGTRRRVLGLGLIGALTALSIAVAAPAQAESLPELGRCVKLAGKTGVFTRANCIGKSKTHTGEYEWESGVGAKKEVKEIANGFLLETASAAKINCSNAQLTGEYTGAKTDKFTKFVLQGCEEQVHHTSCYTNPLSPGAIESETALVGELGFIPGSKVESNPFVGWDLKAESSTSPMLSFSCGEAKGMITFSLEGSVIGKVTKTNVMASGFGLTYKEAAGVQAQTAFIGGSPDVLSLSEKDFGSVETKTSQAGVASGVTVTDGESLEIKAKA